MFFLKLMNEYAKHIITFGASAVCIGVSAAFLSEYKSGHTGPDVDLLRATSAYLKQDHIETPKVVLEDAKNSLAIAGRNEVFREDVIDLGERVQKINDEIGDSENPDVYRPVLDSVAGQIDGILFQKARKQSYLCISAVVGLAGLVGFAKGLSRMK